MYYWMKAWDCTYDPAQEGLEWEIWQWWLKIAKRPCFHYEEL